MLLFTPPKLLSSPLILLRHTLKTRLKNSCRCGWESHLLCTLHQSLFTVALWGSGSVTGQSCSNCPRVCTLTLVKTRVELLMLQNNLCANLLRGHEEPWISLQLAPEAAPDGAARSQTTISRLGDKLQQSSKCQRIKKKNLVWRNLGHRVLSGKKACTKRLFNIKKLLSVLARVGDRNLCFKCCSQNAAPHQQTDAGDDGPWKKTSAVMDSWRSIKPQTHPGKNTSRKTISQIKDRFSPEAKTCPHSN